MQTETTHLRLAIACVACWLIALGDAFAQQDIDDAPIHYNTAKVSDAVSRLQSQLESGDVQLEWDDKHGWLPGLLQLLEVPRESQTLVFSKTSLQTRKISPDRPRALYFSDNVYIGTVQHGDLIEVSAVDKKLGAIFYSLDQAKSDSPQIVRDDNKCLVCHHSSRTRDVPGYLVRSVFPRQDGHPRLDLGTTTTDPTTAFRERFGGWYVSGTHGQMQHRGNAVVEDEGTAWIDADTRFNVTDLANRFDTSRYLSPHSDIVALMVLEHQAQMHNAITQATYEASKADHYDALWNEILDKPTGYVHDVSVRRIEDAGDDLLRCLLFSEEYRLEAPVQGTSDFAEYFQKLGPRDERGRSLREFDLETRLFKYPCSYLIYSESMASLPKRMHDYVESRLQKILSGRDTSGDFDHLSAADRRAIRNILANTLRGFEVH